MEETRSSAVGEPRNRDTTVSARRALGTATGLSGPAALLANAAGRRGAFGALGGVGLALLAALGPSEPGSAA